MKNIKKILKLNLAFLLILGLAASCSKDTVKPNSKNRTNSRNLRAVAAAAMNSNFSDSTSFNDCGCYDIFDNIDFDNLSETEIETAIDNIFNNMTEAQEAYLFDPVCGEDGYVYESACIATCLGVTHQTCTAEQLDDYFYAGLDCTSEGYEFGDSLTFPMEIELPDGSTVTVNNEDELYDALDEWYENNDDWYYEDDLDEDFFKECITFVFPVSMIVDGNTVTVNSEEELIALEDQWFEQNGYDHDSVYYEDSTYSEDSMEIDYPMPVFPIQVTVVETNQVITVNSDMELEAVFEEHCDMFEEDWDEWHEEDGNNEGGRIGK